MGLSLRFSGEDKDMTFGELEEFVEQARSKEVQDDRYVYAEISTSGKIKELSVKIGDDDD